MRSRVLCDFLLLIAIALTIRFLHFFLVADSPLIHVPTSDAYEHYQLALTLSSGDWLGESVGPYHRPQLFAYVVALLFALLGQSFLYIHPFLIILDSIAVGIWYLVGRKCLQRKYALISSIGIALHWPFVYFSSSGYMESFAMFLLSIFILTFLHLISLVMRIGSVKGVYTYSIISGILLALLNLTRPTTLITIPFFILFLFILLVLIKRNSKKFSLSIISLFILSYVLSMSPNALRHFIMFDGLIAPLGTGSELNFHMGNRIDGWGWDKSSPGLEFRIYQNMPYIEGEGVGTLQEVRDFWKGRSLEYITQDTSKFLSGIAMKYLALFNQYEVACTQDYLYFKDKSWLLGLLPGLFFFGPLLLSGCILLTGQFLCSLYGRKSFSRFVKAHGRLLPLLIWCSVYISGVALYLDISRHRILIIPPAFILAGYFCSEVVSALSEKKGRRLLILGVVFCLSLLLNYAPVLDTKYYDKVESWWTQINLAVAEKGLGNNEEALSHLEKAKEIYPEKLETYYQEALTHAGEEDWAEAIDSQKQLLMRFRQQYPAYYMIEAEIFENLGRYQQKAGRIEEAILTFRKLDALVPGVPRAQHLLAMALLEAGETEEAKKILSEVISRSPEYVPSVALMNELKSHSE